MRRIVAVLASVMAGSLLASGMALAATRGEQPSPRPIEHEQIDEPVAAQSGSYEATALFTGHWTSVTPEEKLYYYNPEKAYPKAVAHGARAWNALDKTFNYRGVRLIKVYSDSKATVHIDGIRDCENRGWLAFADDREGTPDWLGLNTCALDKLSGKIRKEVLTHELGHHLGSGHQRLRYCGRSVMVNMVPCGLERIVLTAPGVRDVRWYKNRWVD